MDLMLAAQASPQYIGTSWDGQFDVGTNVPGDLETALRKVIEFDWSEYREVADREMVLSSASSGGNCTVTFNVTTTSRSFRAAAQHRVCERSWPKRRGSRREAKAAAAW